MYRIDNIFHPRIKADIRFEPFKDTWTRLKGNHLPAGTNFFCQGKADCAGIGPDIQTEIPWFDDSIYDG